MKFLSLIWVVFFVTMMVILRENGPQSGVIAYGMMGLLCLVILSIAALFCLDDFAPSETAPSETEERERWG